MARFTQPAGSGGGTELPQGLGTTSAPTFSKITLSSNGAVDNITIGDDAIIGDGNVANHIVIIGQQDQTEAGVVLGSAETEVISTNGTDLSLTADNDIILNPGSNYAYIGTPQLDGSNRIAKMSDISGTSAKTWTAQSDALYEIYQAHGGVEVSLAQPLTLGETITVSGNVENSQFVTVTVSTEMNAALLDVWNSVQHFRSIRMDLGAQTRYFRINNPVDTNVWQLYVSGATLNLSDQSQYWMELQYGGAPVIWWNANDLGIMPTGDEWKFRGAKIEYHAYSVDSGTIIGTIYIASDSGDTFVTHLETNNGVSDAGTVVLWNRSGGERELYAYRTDTEDDTVKIHWTAQVYYGTEYYDA